MTDHNNHFVIDVTSHTNMHYDDGQLNMSGHLNFLNVTDVYQQSLKYFGENKKITVDFSRLDSSNSAVIALMVEWIKFSEKSGIELYFKSLSTHIVSIIKSAGIYSLIESRLSH